LSLDSVSKFLDLFGVHLGLHLELLRDDLLLFHVGLELEERVLEADQFLVLLGDGMSQVLVLDH